MVESLVRSPRAACHAALSTRRRNGAQFLADLMPPDRVNHSDTPAFLIHACDLPRILSDKVNLRRWLLLAVIAPDRAVMQRGEARRPHIPQRLAPLHHVTLASPSEPRTPPASDSQGWNAVAPRCRKQRQNAHGTEERQVLYELHPWFGRLARLHEVIEKSGGKVYRCSCDGDAVDRWLELPAWMFDRVACATIRTVAVPLVEVAALQALRLLLAVVLRQRISEDASSTVLGHGAALASHEQTRREGDARATKASSSASDRKRAVRAAHRARLRQPAAETDLGSASVAGPRGADRPDDAPSPRSRVERSSSRTEEVCHDV